MNADDYLSLSALFFLMFFPGGVAVGYALGIWRGIKRHDQARERFEQRLAEARGRMTR